MSSEGREPTLEQESRQHRTNSSVWLQGRPSFVYEIYSKRRIAPAWLCKELKEELSFTLGAALCSPGTGRRGALKKRSTCPRSRDGGLWLDPKHPGPQLPSGLCGKQAFYQAIANDGQVHGMAECNGLPK